MVTFWWLIHFLQYRLPFRLLFWIEKSRNNGTPTTSPSPFYLSITSTTPNLELPCWFDFFSPFFLTEVMREWWWPPNGNSWWWRRRPCCLCLSFRRHHIRPGRRRRLQVFGFLHLKRRRYRLPLRIHLMITTCSFQLLTTTTPTPLRRRRTTTTATAIRRRHFCRRPRLCWCRRRLAASILWLTSSSRRKTSVFRLTSVCWWCCRAVWFWWWDWWAIVWCPSSSGTIATCATRPTCSCSTWAWPTSSSFVSACPPSSSRFTNDETPGYLAKSCVSPSFLILFN